MIDAPEVSEHARNLIDTHGFAELMDYIASLESQVAALSKDRDRLDWRDKMMAETFRDSAGWVIKWRDYNGHRFATYSAQGKSLRDAIDQAMQVSEQEVKE